MVWLPRYGSSPSSELPRRCPSKRDEADGGGRSSRLIAARTGSHFPEVEFEVELVKARGGLSLSFLQFSPVFVLYSMGTDHPSLPPK